MKFSHGSCRLNGDRLTARLFFCGGWNQTTDSYQELDIVCSYKVSSPSTWKVPVWGGERRPYRHCLLRLHRFIEHFCGGLDWSSDWGWTPGVPHCKESGGGLCCGGMLLSRSLTDSLRRFQTENQLWVWWCSRSLQLEGGASLLLNCRCWLTRRTFFRLKWV